MTVRHICFAALLLLIMLPNTAFAQNYDAWAEEMQVLLREHGLIAAEGAGTLEVDSLLVGAQWKAAESACAALAQKQLQTPAAPRGLFRQGQFLANDPRYEEIMLRAIHGKQHQHLEWNLQRQIHDSELPVLKPNFRAAGGRPNYEALAKEVNAEVQDGGLECDPQSPTVSERSAIIMTKWMSEPAKNLAGTPVQLETRILLRVAVVEGKRSLPGIETFGPSRLALTTVLQSRLRDAQGKESGVYSTPPVNEMAMAIVEPVRVSRTTNVLVPALMPEPTPLALRPLALHLQPNRQLVLTAFEAHAATNSATYKKLGTIPATAIDRLTSPAR